MKKLLLFILFLFAVHYGSMAQENIIKEDLFKLYYKAQRAEKNGNKEEALDIYKTLLAIDSNLPAPYLKMANIYAVDENNAASVASAVALYNRYLSLQPHDENTATIKNKVASLQKFVGNEQSINLADIVHINQEQAQDIVITNARRGIRPTTKEELEKHVVETNMLYDQAQQAQSGDNIETNTQYVEQFLEQSEPDNPLTSQANMMLAEMYRKQGNMQKMQNELFILEDNLKMYKQMQQYYNTTLKDVLPFEEDICGIWVSDLAYNEATPFLAIEIQKDSKAPQKYQATVLPYCMLAEKHKMYTGKPFSYETKYSTNTQSYFANSTIDSVHLDADLAYFYFGNRKYRGTSKEVDEFVIKPVIGAVGEATKGAVAAATNTKRSYTDAQITAAGIEIIGALIQFGLAQSTTKKTTEISLELNMQRLFAGCADINLIHNTFVTNTNEYEKESTDSMQVRLYKLYSDDKILFAAKGNELFGYKTFSKDEILQTEEYEHLQALKSRGYFNKQAYKKLSEKINDFCFSKASENSDFTDWAYDCRMRIEYATKGLSYRTIQNRYGCFEGWVDLSGKKNGIGKCVLNDGTTYIGSWENNKYSGEGKITFRDKETYEVSQEYTGTFKNNKYYGKGLLYKEKISYDGEFVDGSFGGFGQLTDANGNKYEGIWKYDIPDAGNITYTNGDRYEGQCIYNKKTQQIERHGKGTMVYVNGDIVTGKWKNDELTSKK